MPRAWSPGTDSIRSCAQRQRRTGRGGSKPAVLQRRPHRDGRNPATRDPLKGEGGRVPAGPLRRCAFQDQARPARVRAALLCLRAPLRRLRCSGIAGFPGSLGFANTMQHSCCMGRSVPPAQRVLANAKQLGGLTDRRRAGFRIMVLSWRVRRRYQAPVARSRPDEVAGHFSHIDYRFAPQISRQDASECDEMRQFANRAIRAKILQSKDFCGFGVIRYACFPSWTSAVRIRSPAINPCPISTYINQPSCTLASKARKNGTF